MLAQWELLVSWAAHLPAEVRGSIVEVALQHDDTPQRSLPGLSCLFFGFVHFGPGGSLLQYCHLCLEAAKGSQTLFVRAQTITDTRRSTQR
jgi:hypothetical protein